MVKGVIFYGFDDSNGGITIFNRTKGIDQEHKKIALPLAMVAIFLVT